MAKRFVSSGSVEVDRALMALQATFPDLSVFEGVRGLSATLSTTPLRIATGLKRKYRGFLVIGLSTPAIITDDLTQPDLDTYIHLTASTGTPEVRLLVF